MWCLCADEPYLLCVTWLSAEEPANIRCMLAMCMEAYAYSVCMLPMYSGAYPYTVYGAFVQIGLRMYCAWCLCAEQPRY